MEREKAEEARSILWKIGAVDRTREVVEREGAILIPLLMTDIGVSNPPGEIIEVPSVPRQERQEKPFDTVVGSLDIPSPAKKKLPRRWELIGDILILKIDSSLAQYKEEIAEGYAKVLRAKTVLEDVGGICGEFREPRFRTIIGEDTTTIHKENGIRFKLDVSKIMFSSGNIEERIRMASVCGKKEVIVDMFAGIGYFSLPIAVHSSPARIYACEKYPLAYEYLCENARLNGVQEVVEPILGDCREVAPEGVADRIVMGYLKETHKFLPKALKVLKGKGRIHYHESCPNELLPHRPLERLKKASKGWKMRVENYRVVKSYAPGVSHIAVDVFLEP